VAPRLSCCVVSIRLPPEGGNMSPARVLVLMPRATTSIGSRWPRARVSAGVAPGTHRWPGLLRASSFSDPDLRSERSYPGRQRTSTRTASLSQCSSAGLSTFADTHPSRRTKALRRSPNRGELRCACEAPKKTHQRVTPSQTRARSISCPRPAGSRYASAANDPPQCWMRTRTHSGRVAWACSAPCRRSRCREVQRARLV
jgi:hypothetical protein